MPISDVMFQGDLPRRVAELERRLTEVTSGRRLEDASVGARGIRLHNGGGITVDDGGRVVLRNAIGVDLAYFGPIGGGSQGNPGWRLNYDNSDPAISLQGPPGRQFAAVRDIAGNIAFSTDSETRTGLARPYIPLRLVPSFDAQQVGTSMWPSTDATAATKLMQGINPLFHPKITIGVAMAGAGGIGHWRLDIAGETVLTDQTTAGIRTVNVPGWGDEIKPGDAIGIDLYGWITNGPGRVYLQCDRLYGQQS